MGVIDRVSRLVRANVNDLLDQAEDPEKMIDQIIRDMESNITDARRQVAAMIAQEKELEYDRDETQKLPEKTIWPARRSAARRTMPTMPRSTISSSRPRRTRSAS
jgi:phage shock protein A